MIAGVSLLALGTALLVVGPRLAGVPWTHQAPRLAVFMWQALTVGAVGAVVLAGVTLLIPITVLAGDLGAIVHACAMSIATAYGSSELLPGKLVGILLSGALPAWVLLCALRVVGSSWRTRRRLRQSLSSVTEPDAHLGAAVMDTAAPAAFCVPGRHARIVITSGALERLSPLELEGVLAHEVAHLRGRHDVAVALSQVLAVAFPRVRLFQVATAQTRQLIELLADDVAARRVDRLSLASAIVNLADMRAPRAALAMAQEAAVLRVNRLLSPREPLEPWRHRLGAFAALAVVLVPLLIAGYPTVSAALSDLCNI